MKQNPKMKNHSFTGFFFAVLFLAGCGGEDNPPHLSPDINTNDLKMHIAFLAGDDLKGRETGSPEMAVAANYLADHFKQFGLKPVTADNRFVQEMQIDLATYNLLSAPDPSSDESRRVVARNIFGIVKGTRQPDTYIVIGAHYDHLGMGGHGSLHSENLPEIHNGADDNASGTSGLLELAHYYSQHPPQKSLLFIAFTGEELGLLGSRKFVEQSPIPLSRIQAMINLDMIGRMQHEKLLIFGTGTSDEWENLIFEADVDSLVINTIPDGSGASDHTNFYNQGIPVLHYFTGTHPEYHRPTDDVHLINYHGEVKILQHVVRLVDLIGELPDDELAFSSAPITQNRTFSSNVTLGVVPDYTFNQKGMRITNVRQDGTADRAGLEAEDVIVGIGGEPIDDIYDYMDKVKEFQKGDRTTLTVQRDGKKLTFDITW